jgi:gliding motility-associated-like protein
VANPGVQIRPARAVTEICEGDSIRLEAVTSGGATFRYQWLRDNQPLPTIAAMLQGKQSGQYRVTIVDETGCRAESSLYSFSISQTIRITLDSIPAFCGIDHPTLTLKGYPVMGVFSGPGITGNQYDPRQAGLGTHTIRYTVNSPFACQNGSASRIAIIRPIPALELGPDREIARGSEMQLRTGLGTDYSYIWTPSISLSDPKSSSPLAMPDKNTRYTVYVKDAYGCEAKDSLEVRVYDRIWVPDAFSPNNDGVNDSWELRGIETYPEAEVTIYNRWGTVIFYSRGYSKPFDALYMNERIQPGIYPYVIKPSSTQQVLRGDVTVLY